jgi:hypothetical protein
MRQSVSFPLSDPANRSQCGFGIYDRGQLAIRGNRSERRQIMVDLAREVWG